MKIKKNLITLLVLGCFSLCSVSFAQNISLVPQNEGVFGIDCLVPIDIYLDTIDQRVVAMDLIVKTKMEYVDFVPSELFPYYLPPVIRSNGFVHIAGFAINPNERVSGSGFVGTIYLKNNSDLLDGVAELYYIEEGDTTDTNLSINGVDVLKDIEQLKEKGSAYVRFSKTLPVCYHESASVISGGFAGLSYDESLNATLKKIQDKYGKLSFWSFLQNNIFFVLLVFLLILIVLFFVYRKQLLSHSHKDILGKKQVS